MDDLNFICTLHDSPIGGVCSDLFCKENNPLLCIKCAINENSCIRKYNHELITLEEFTKKYSNDLRSKFQDKEITIFELIKFISDFKFDKAEKDYLISLKEREEIFLDAEKDLTKKIVDMEMKSNIHRRIQKIRDDSEQVRELIILIEGLEKKGFDFIPRDRVDVEKFYYIIEELKKNYPELEFEKKDLKFLFGDQNFIEKENEVDKFLEDVRNDNSSCQENLSKYESMTDYQKIQNLVKLFKNLDGEPKLKNYPIQINKTLEIIDNYENKILIQPDETADEFNKFDSIISSLELLIPTLFSSILKVLKTKENNFPSSEKGNKGLNILENEKENSQTFNLQNQEIKNKSFKDNENEQINLKDNSVIEEESSKLLYNESTNFLQHFLDEKTKLKFCDTNPKNLKFRGLIDKEVQKKINKYNTICVFQTIDEIDYLAYPSDNQKIYIFPLNNIDLCKFDKYQIIEKVGDGSISQISHYRHNNEKDYLFVLTTNYKIFSLDYDIKNQRFNLNQKYYKVSNSENCFEIMEINYTHYLLYPSNNQYLQKYTLPDLNKEKNIYHGLSSTIIFMKSFHHKYLNKNCLVLGSMDRLVVIVPEFEKEVNTVNIYESKLGSFYYNCILIDNPQEHDYYLLASHKSEIQIFKLKENNLFMSIQIGAPTRSLLLWNEKVFCLSTMKGDIIFYEFDRKGCCIIQTLKHGKLGAGISNILSQVNGLYSFKNKDYGDVLISSSGGLINFWCQ
jgi:hypothetical protein